MYQIILVLTVFVSTCAMSFTLGCKNPHGTGTTLEGNFEGTALLVETDRGGKRTVLISQGETCGIKTDFATQCLANHVKGSEVNEFSFRCNTIFGDFYYSFEPGSEVEYRCFGDNISKEFRSRVYTECRRKD